LQARIEPLPDSRDYYLPMRSIPKVLLVPEEHSQPLVAHIFRSSVSFKPRKFFMNLTREYGHQLPDFVRVNDYFGSGGVRIISDLTGNLYRDIEASVQIKCEVMPSEMQAKCQYAARVSISKLKESVRSSQMTLLEDRGREHLRNCQRAKIRICRFERHRLGWIKEVK
jgi:hypothetical protein